MKLGTTNTNLDHKFSIYEGFKKDVSPEIIGHISNLHFIPWQENRAKGDSSIITLNELKKEAI